LLETGGRSRDRYRNATERPRRKDYRPYRNRAIVYTLIETGMRRSAVVGINWDVTFLFRERSIFYKHRRVTQHQ
jgi:integrase